jgi:hypothetical protein
MAEIKVFAMNDCDWYAGETLEQAEQAMAENLSYDSVEALRADGIVEDPAELTSSDMDCLMYAEDTEDGAPGEVQITFRARLDEMIAAGENFPCFFASTEC